MPMDLLSRQLANIVGILVGRNLEQGTMRRGLAVNLIAREVSVTEEFASMASRGEDIFAEYTHLEKKAANGVHPTRRFAAAMSDMDWVNSLTHADSNSDGEDDPKKMLTKLHGTQRLPRIVAPESDHSPDDVKKTLAELNKQVSSVVHANIDDDPRMMLADVNQQARLSSQKLVEDDDNNLEALRSRLTTMVSPLHGGSAQGLGFSNDNRNISGVDTAAYKTEPESHSKTNVHISMALDKEIIPYAVALELEYAGCDWDKAKGWTTYLYSSGPRGYAVQQENDMMVQRAVDKFEANIQKCLEEEMSYCQSVEKERLLCRLIVSNLAADANEEELRLFFYRHKFDVHDVRFLGQRDPLRRTRVAQVDMFTRTSAVRASYVVGSIFGLGLKINLAVEEAN